MNQLKKIFLYLLIGLGVSRSIFGIIDSPWSQKLVRHLSYLYISPYPKAFDQPSYFANYKIRFFTQDDEEKDSKINLGLIPGPWLRKAAIAHGFMDLPKMRQDMAKQFAKYYLCTDLFFGDQSSPIQKASISISDEENLAEIYNLDVLCKP